MSNASTPSSTSSSSNVPRVGGVRCYWALVTPTFPIPGLHESKLALKFVHPDPVLGAHLARQQMTMVGRDMLDFIHPNERDQARKDLGGAISTNDLQGSVTRVRFARLSRIREILGGTKDEIEYPTDAQTFVEDEEYLILDLVLNWAGRSCHVADGILLAFFHAIRDKDPVSNNDPGKRNEEWTNFCGTANMPEDQLEALQTNLCNTVNPHPTTNYPPTRVFQLHTTPSSPTRPDQLVFSWPPPRGPKEPHSRFDGRYDALEYADLMKGVDMDPAALQTTETKTNCTTRFGATHSLTSEGVYRVISSVYIPYGNLIFACFQTIKLVDPSSSRSPRKSLPTLEPIGTPPQNGSPWTAQEPEEDWDTPEYRPHLDTEYTDSPGGGVGYRPRIGQIQAFGFGYGLGPTPEQADPSAGRRRMLPRLVKELDWDQPYPSSTHQPTRFQAAPQPPVPRHTPETQHQQSNYPPSEYPRPFPVQIVAVSTPDIDPHSQAPIPQHLLPSHTPSYPPPPPPPMGHPHVHTPEQARNGPPYGETPPSRPLIPPPGDVEKCVLCGIRESPEWRRNTSGIKDLCNACGLRLRRQVAKREGKQKPRKKKDKDKPQTGQKSPQDGSQ